MIMGDKSISVLLHADDGVFNPKTLEVWFKVLKKYKHGAELILLSFNEDDQVPEEFQTKHENDGVRIVHIVSSLPYNWTNVMKESFEYIEGEYVWVSASYTYPNGNIMEEVEEHLRDDILYVLNGTFIPAPFNYSTTSPLVREPNDILFRPPCIDIESFTVSSDAFVSFASIITNQGINGSHVANSWRDLLGITWEYSYKATVFIVNNQ